jgi:hypothetical protein
MLLRLIPCAVMLAMAACAGPPGAARPHAAANADGAAPTGPRGIVSSFPPADNSFVPLRCKPDGPNTICTRSE